MKDFIKNILYWLKDYFKKRIFGFSTLFIMYGLFIFPTKGININSIIDYLIVIFILFLGIIAYGINNLYIDKIDSIYGTNGEVDGENIMDRINDFSNEYNATLKRIGGSQNKYIILIIMFILQAWYITTH